MSVSFIAELSPVYCCQVCPINQVPSEDCLYLTVATPALQEQDALLEQPALQGQAALQGQGAVNQNASLPVMVGLSAPKYIYLLGQNMTSYS